MNRVDPAVVNALRVLGLSEVDLGQSCEGSWTRALAHAPVSVANERWVAASLRARLERELCRCESSLEDDLAALEQSSDSITNVLQLRDNNKVLINSVIEKLDNFLKHEAAPDERIPNLLEEMPDYMPNVRVL